MNRILLKTKKTPPENRKKKAAKIHLKNRIRKRTKVKIPTGRIPEKKRTAFPKKKIPAKVKALLPKKEKKTLSGSRNPKKTPFLRKRRHGCGKRQSCWNRKRLCAGNARYLIGCLPMMIRRGIGDEKKISVFIAVAVVFNRSSRISAERFDFSQPFGVICRRNSLSLVFFANGRKTGFKAAARGFGLEN